ncbi:MAG: cell division topological specificity factor MinE [Lysobacteraceae bacterium]
MGIFDFLKPRQNSAAQAKKRLQVLIATERMRDGHDYLPDLRRDILAVLHKHVPGFSPEAVNVEIHKDGDQDVLDITVSLPETAGERP